MLDADVEKNLTVAITTDKGLCGGINSTVCRYVRGINHMYEAGALCQASVCIRVIASVGLGSVGAPQCSHEPRACIALDEPEKAMGSPSRHAEALCGVLTCSALLMPSLDVMSPARDLEGLEVFRESEFMT